MTLSTKGPKEEAWRTCTAPAGARPILLPTSTTKIDILTMVKIRWSFNICSLSCLDLSKCRHILQSDSPLLQGIRAGYPFKEVLHKLIRQLFKRLLVSNLTIRRQWWPGYNTLFGLWLGYTTTANDLWWIDKLSDLFGCEWEYSTPNPMG